MRTEVRSKLACMFAFVGVFVLGIGCGFMSASARNTQQGAILGAPRPDPNKYCIANREDNTFHIGLVLVSACGAFSSVTGLTHDQLNCDKPGKGASGAKPPASCQGTLAKADWVFSTTYQLTGSCDQHHGAKKNAAMLIDKADLGTVFPGRPLAVCAEGWNGKGDYDDTQ
mmetsp:Transcript_25173/g.73873  ORF Transcript_25173/g.73873 Transcript_25173/m.73873 type:complete len:170 (-) Transcript_25173:199-708(-)